MSTSTSRFSSLTASERTLRWLIRLAERLATAPVPKVSSASATSSETGVGVRVQVAEGAPDQHRLGAHHPHGDVGVVDQQVGRDAAADARDVRRVTLGGDVQRLLEQAHRGQDARVVALQQAAHQRHPQLLRTAAPGPGRRAASRRAASPSAAAGRGRAPGRRCPGAARVPAATTTASTSSASSRTGAQRAPYRSAVARPTRSSGSTTATSLAASEPAITRACRDPMDPAPTRVMRSGVEIEMMHS